MTSVEPHLIDAAADRLAAATATRRPCEPVSDLIARDDIDSAYRIQTRNIEISLARGRTVVGRKIGLTSPAVQKQMGVEQPDFGVLLDDMDCSGDDEIAITRLIQPRMEAEIAMVLSHDITEFITGESAPAYVESVWAALEIVDSRIVDWNISLADTVADNASSGLYVLGDRVTRADAPALADVEMTMTANGETVSTGRGADCLGSPWAAMAWLANTSLSYGTPLRAGEVILSGALGPMVAVEPHTTYTATMSGIGSVTTTFTH